MKNDRGREIKLTNIDKFNIKYGSLDKICPEVMYIRAKTKVKPFVKKGDYSKDILIMKTDFIKSVGDIIHRDKNFQDTHICHFDTNENGMMYNKNSYIKYDVFIKPIHIKHINEYEKQVYDLVYAFNSKLTSLLEKNNMSYI